MADKKDQVANETVTDKKPAAKKTATAKAPAEKKATATKTATKTATAKAPAEKKATATKTATAKVPAEKKATATKTTTAKAKAPAKAKAVTVKAGDTSGNTRGRLKAIYKSQIVPALMTEGNYKNVNQVPALEKIVINMRLGDIKDNSKSIQMAQKELDAITGQRSVIVKAKKSVANFKLRENQPIGIKVTLRAEQMYEFFDKLVTIALPRVRDFRGISGKSFDGRGNYATGIKEQIIFPEISYEAVEKVRGFDVCIVTTANTDAEAKALLVKLGMPFKN